jgi:hypothetical protein
MSAGDFDEKSGGRQMPWLAVTAVIRLFDRSPQTICYGTLMLKRRDVKL